MDAQSLSLTHTHACTHTPSHLCKSSLRSFVVPESNWGTSPRSASFLVWASIFTRPLHLLQSDISLFNPLCLLCFLVQVF